MDLWDRGTQIGEAGATRQPARRLHCRYIGASLCSPMIAYPCHDLRRSTRCHEGASVHGDIWCRDDGCSYGRPMTVRALTAISGANVYHPRLLDPACCLRLSDEDHTDS